MACWVLAAAGCVDPTQFVVFVDSDFRDGELDAFEVRVIGPDGQVHRRGPFALQGDDPTSLPASFGVAPVGGDPHRVVEVQADAIVGDDSLFTTRARTSFVRDRSVRVDLFLARRCRTEWLDCSEEETCTDRGCEPIDVPAEDLRPADEPPPPRDAQDDWTLWADGAASGTVVVGDRGEAFVAVITGDADDFEIGGAQTALEPEEHAFLARVEPDGSVAWLDTFRPAQALSLVSLYTAAVADDVLWVWGSAPTGFDVNRAGESIFRQEGPDSLFVLRVDAVDGAITGSVFAAAGFVVSASGTATTDSGVLALGGLATGPGSILGASWNVSGPRGLLLTFAPDLASAEACTLEADDSAIEAIVGHGEEIITVGRLGMFGAAFARSVQPGCGASWSVSVADASSVPAAGMSADRLAIVAVSPYVSLRHLDPDSGAELARAPLTFAGDWARFGMAADRAGRHCVYNGFRGAVDFDVLSGQTDDDVAYAGLLLGVGPALEGRWIRLLQSSGSGWITGAALDDWTGAVIFTGTGTGTVRLGDDVLGTRVGSSVLVHRFIP